MGVAIALSHITSVASSTVVCVDSTFAGAASVGASRQGASFSEHRGGGGGGNIIGGRAHHLSSCKSFGSSSLLSGACNVKFDDFLGRPVAVRAAADDSSSDSFLKKGTRFLKLGGRKQEEEEEEAGEAIRGRKGTQRIRGRKKKKQREEEESASDEPSLFGTQLFSNFGLKRGESQNGTARRGGALVPRKETTAVDVLSFGRGRRQDPRTVFVAGATGQTGSRISQQLLHAGFNVRGGVGDLFFAQQLAEFATQYGVISREEAKRLNAVEFDFKDVNSIAKALGNASKVVVTIGPAEDGPRSKVTVEDALRVLEAAQVANAGHFIVVSEPGAKNDGPLAGISAFFSSLFSGGSVAQDAYLIDSVVESDLTFTVIKTGSTEGVDDASQDTSNLVVSAEGASDTGGKVSKIQIASVVASVFSNTSVSENKVVEVTSDPYASPKPIEEFLSQIPVDGRRAILEAERAKAEIEEREREAQRLADAEAQAAVEQARQASQLAAQLEAEAKKLAAEEAKAATVAAKAQAKAEAAAASVDGLEAKVKELGINTFSNPLGGRSLGSFIPKLEEVKSRLPKGEKEAIPELATATEIGQKPARQFFGGLFKQDTIYVDED
jgi:hypothetical protein